MKKVFIFSLGTLLLSPIVLAACADDAVFGCVMIVYGFILWHSPKFSPKVRKFWKNFWRINIEMTKYDN